MPKVVFQRSKLYDAHLARSNDFVVPEDSVFESKIESLSSEWDIYGEKIIKAIEKESGLTWHRKEIICYITAGIIPFSDPLTLNLRSTLDTLTHELIHCILSEPENRERWNKVWDNIQKKYSAESETTKIHIIVHAIHTPILKLFGEEHYVAEKKSMATPDYGRAWEIVEQEGYSKIIETLK